MTLIPSPPSPERAPTPQPQVPRTVPSPGPGLQVAGLDHTFPGYAPTLRGAALQVRPGQNAFLLGPSGAGKSTLLRCIAGLTRPDAGSLHLDGRRLDDVPAHQRRIGMVFQDPLLFPHLRVWQNVAFGMRYRPDVGQDGPGHPRDPSAPSAAGPAAATASTHRPCWPSRRAAERREAEAWLELVSFPGRADARVDELSGGQRQRVALARTLAARPRAVLLDEPFSGLDRAVRDELGLRVSALLRQQGVAALWVTHDEEEAFRLGDQVWRLAAGACVAVPVQDRPGQAGLA